MSTEPQCPASPEPATGRSIRTRFFLSFGLFVPFFLFYMGTAIIQTPTLREFAMTPALGMPLGLLLSLMVFPLSWLLIAVYFAVWK
ncbi:MAG: hypothetical protein WC712_10785 [Candidatus Brocadiia bacterium]